MRYPLWHYPVLFWWLLIFLKRWKFKVRSLLQSRQDCGVIAQGKNPTLEQIVSFGHWGAGFEWKRWKPGDNYKA